jgi:diaminopimelate decarboxylase
LFDQATRCQLPATAILRRRLSGPFRLTYAAKAFLCLAIAAWTQQQDQVDCNGIGEISIAAAAVSRQHIWCCVNKSQADLQAALSQAGTIVVDNLTELQNLAAQAKQHSQALPDLWLRLRPGLAVQTHVHTQTGQDDSKFGMSHAEFTQAVQFCLQNNLPLTGLHFHQGSHFHDPAPLAPAIETALDLAAELRTTPDAGCILPRRRLG